MTDLPEANQPHNIAEWLGPDSIQKELRRNREGGRITYLANDPNQGQPVVLKQFRLCIGK